MKNRITPALERFSKAMLAPLSYLSAAGLLLVAGALLTSTALAEALPFLRWAPVRLLGQIIYKCLTAVINNLSVLFCVGIAASLARREKHQAGLIALMSYLIYLTAGNVTLTELGSLAADGVTYTGAYVVMMTEYNLGLPFSDGIVWMYTGFTKTFGYFGIAAAFIFCARKENRKKTAAQLLPLAFTASLASITEPLDFLFCFSAPVLWLAHAVISGCFIVLLHLCHVTAFTSNLLGSLLMNLSAGVARTNYPVLYLLGVAEIGVYFVVFTALIKMLDLPTPGRRPEEPAHPEKALPLDEKPLKTADCPWRAGEYLFRGQLLHPPAHHGERPCICEAAGAESPALQRCCGEWM